MILPTARDRIVSFADSNGARVASRSTLLAAVGLLVIGLVRDALPQDPEGGPFVEDVLVPVLASLLALTAVGVALSFRWRRAGLATATFGGFYGFTVSALHHEPGVWIVVLVVMAVPIALMWREQLSTSTAARTAVLGTGVVAVVAVAGLVSTRIYAHFLGPSHPESQVPELADSLVRWVWSGAVDTDGFSVTAVLSESAPDLQLVVIDPSGVVVDRTEPRLVEPGTPVRIDVDGLEPSTEYRYVFESAGRPDELRAGVVTTFPEGPASITMAVGGCARNHSNGAVFDAIREVDPDLFIVAGDIHYRDIVDDDPRQFATAYDQIHDSPARSLLHRTVPIAYVWDDHDFGANDSDSRSESRPAAWSTYRRFVPHYDLPTGAEGSIQQAFTMGRVRVVMLDTRSERLSSEATMLGASQLQWLLDELLSSRDTHALTVLVSPNAWIGRADPGADHWGAFADERNRIGEFLAANDIANVVMVAGDAHMVAIDDGSNSGYGGADGFPVLQAGALDQLGRVKGGPYSHGTFPGGGQFGVVEVTDDGGDRIEVELTGLDWEGTVLTSFSTSFVVP